MRNLGKIRIAVAQINPTVGDIDANLKRIRSALDRAARRRAGLVVFPEMALPGYPPEDLLFKRHFVTQNLFALRRLAGLSRRISVILGFVDRDAHGRLYNAAAYLQGGRIAAVYHKLCLPNYGVFDEKRYFSAGEEALFLRGGGGEIALSICEDIWPSDSPFLAAAVRRRPSIVINISASPYHFGKLRQREALAQNRARQIGAALVYANLVGGQDELVFDGSSFISTPSGNILASAARFKEDLMVCDVPFQKSPRRPAPISKKNAGNTHIPCRIKKTTFVLSAGPELPKTFKSPGTSASPDGGPAEIYAALCLGTRDYVMKNRFKKVLVGLSGGIDSALVALIAADSIGPKNVIGVTMPSRFSSKATRADARRTARMIGVACLEIPIEKLRRAYLRLFSRHFKRRKPDATEENLQSRIRGNILMALSNKFGYLVLTTGNKSEMATGYCTLYGDMAGGFAVIKDVPKGLVYELARYRNSLEVDPPIPESVLCRPPSAELRANQKDTDSLPPYAVLDPILEAYIEKDASLGELAAKGFNRRTARAVVQKVDSSEYKRRQGPIGIKITPKAFGRDRRMPVTSGFKQ